MCTSASCKACVQPVDQHDVIAIVMTIIPSVSSSSCNLLCCLSIIRLWVAHVHLQLKRVIPQEHIAAALAFCRRQGALSTCPIKDPLQGRVSRSRWGHPRPPKPSRIQGTILQPPVCSIIQQRLVRQHMACGSL